MALETKFICFHVQLGISLLNEQGGNAVIMPVTDTLDVTDE